jgi:hypothetical protein
MPKQEPEEKQTTETAADPTTSPIAFAYENREALYNMAQEHPKEADAFMDMLFEKHLLPKYKEVNPQGLSMEEEEGLKHAFFARLFDMPGQRQVKIKDPKEYEPGLGARALGTVEGGVAGTLGGVRKFSEFVAKYDKSDLTKDPIHKGISKIENYIYQDALARAPAHAKLGAALGHEVPALAAGGMAEKAVPALEAGAKAPTVMKMAQAGARGALGGGAYGAVKGEGNAQRDAMWGGLISASFPLVAKMLGPKIAKFVGIGDAPPQPAAPRPPQGVPGAVPTGGALPPMPTPGVPTPGAPPPMPTPGVPPAAAAKPARRTMSSVADEVAQELFPGKSFKDLTPDERSQVPKRMAQKEMERKAAAKAAKDAESKAKKDVVTQAQKLVQEQKEAEAKKAAETQAAAKVPTPTPTPTPTPAPTTPTPAAKPKGEASVESTIAKAAEENPATAKIMQAAAEAKSGKTAEYTGPERRVQVGRPPTEEERRKPKTVYEMSKSKVEADAAKAEETKAKEATVAEKAKTAVTVDEAKAFLKKDPKRWAAFEKMDEKRQNDVLIKAKQAIEDLRKQGKDPLVTKVPEGQHGTGKEATRAKDRERKQKARAEGKAPAAGREITGGGVVENIMKKLEETKSLYTSETVSMMDVPELEEAIKALPDGELLIDGAKAAERRYKRPKEDYVHVLKEILEEQLSRIKPDEGTK